MTFLPPNYHISRPGSTFSQACAPVPSCDRRRSLSQARHRLRPHHRRWPAPVRIRLRRHACLGKSRTGSAEWTAGSAHRSPLNRTTGISQSLLKYMPDAQSTWEMKQKLSKTMR